MKDQLGNNTIVTIKKGTHLIIDDVTHNLHGKTIELNEDIKTCLGSKPDAKIIDNIKLGLEEGDICNRNKCTGIIELTPLIDCTCNVSAPCGSCLAREFYCPTCDWQETDDK